MSTEDKIPLIETYGPVMQGEGSLIGRPTWFVRLGACDYRCHYCDSMHAVDPREIDKRKRIVSAKQLAEETIEAMGDCPLATLSGGNPALWELGSFVEALHNNRPYKKVAIETQGSVFKEWLLKCDYVTVSPKGPGMVDDWEKGLDLLLLFLAMFEGAGCEHRIILKVPIFGDGDLVFCQTVRLALLQRGLRIPPMYLSVGNPRVSMLALKSEGELPDVVAHRNLLMAQYEALFEQVMEEFPDLADCAILPQMHVLMYGNQLGR